MVELKEAQVIEKSKLKPILIILAIILLVGGLVFLLEPEA